MPACAHHRPLGVPANDSYCWLKRDSAGAREDPGNNVYDDRNVFLSSQGQLVLQVARDSTGNFSTGEVVLDRSLGVGDYIWTFATAADEVRIACVHVRQRIASSSRMHCTLRAQVHHHLAGGAFLYEGALLEYDIELSRWGQPLNNNTQYVAQPWNADPGAHYFNLSGPGITHRLRWGGTTSLSQIAFQAWGPDGSLLQNYTALSECTLPGACQGHALLSSKQCLACCCDCCSSGGNLISDKGLERVHMNHWCEPALSMQCLHTHTCHLVIIMRTHSRTHSRAQQDLPLLPEGRGTGAASRRQPLCDQLLPPLPAGQPGCLLHAAGRQAGLRRAAARRSCRRRHWCRVDAHDLIDAVFALAR